MRNSNTPWSMVRFGNIEREINEMLGHLRPDAQPVRATRGLHLGQDEDNVYVELIVPGLKADAFEITYEDQVLTIKGERKSQSEGVVRVLHKERFEGSFERKVKVGVTVNADAIRAEYRAGILNITLQKAEAVKPRRIDVQTS